jgi:membrane-associated phospholipid phosphatase
LGVTPVWLVVAALVVFVLTTLDVVDHGFLTSYDHAASRHLVGLHVRQHVWLKRAVYLLTYFGQRGPVLIVTVPAVAYLCWRTRSLELAVRYALGLIALTILVYAVKDGVGRTAPTVDRLHTSSGQSYPSGHLATAVSIWWLLWYYVRGLDPAAPLARLLGVIRIIGPLCVIAGMSLLDYHWQSDFIAGACIGIVVLGAVTVPALTTFSRSLDGRVWRAPSRSDLT